jgi:hypothetical protein
VIYDCSERDIFPIGGVSREYPHSVDVMLQENMLSARSGEDRMTLFELGAVPMFHESTKGDEIGLHCL